MPYVPNRLAAPPPGPKNARDVVAFHMGQTLPILGAWAEVGGGNRSAPRLLWAVGYLLFSLAFLGLPAALTYFLIGQPGPATLLWEIMEARWPSIFLPLVVLLWLGLTMAFLATRRVDAIWVRTPLGLAWLRLGSNLPRDPLAFEHWAWADCSVLPSGQKEGRWWLGPSRGLRQEMLGLESGARPPKAPLGLPGPSFWARWQSCGRANQALMERVWVLQKQSNRAPELEPQQIASLHLNPTPPPTLQGVVPPPAWPIDVGPGQPDWVKDHDLPWEEGQAFWAAAAQQSAD